MARRLLSAQEAAARLAEIPGWEQEGKLLRREFEFPSFARAFAFMTQVAREAERLKHHPDWCNTYNQVRVELTTHDAGGLTGLDFQLAAFMDEACRAHGADPQGRK